MSEFETFVSAGYLFGKNYERAVRTHVVCPVWKNPDKYIDIYMRKRGKLVEILLPELYDETTDKEKGPAASIEVDFGLRDLDLKKWLGTNITEHHFTCLAYPGTSIEQKGIQSCNIHFKPDGTMLISPARGFFIKDPKFGCGTFSTVLSFINEYDIEEEYTFEPATKRHPFDPPETNN